MKKKQNLWRSKKIQRKQKDKNMKKKDLIDRTCISPTTISKMIRGEAVLISVI